MKKLMMMALVMMTAMFAKAELTLYWELANYAFSGATYARLYGLYGETETRLASVILTPGAESMEVRSVLQNVVAPFSDYSAYIVKLFDESRDTVLATSGTLETSLAYHVYNAGSTDAPPETPWTVSAFAVPEPTSGLLVLLGMGALALKRKRA